LHSKRIGVEFDLSGHVTSSVMWPFDSPLAISNWWWPFGTKPLSNGFRDIQWRMWRNDLHDLKRQRSRSFILVQIDFSYKLLLI